jgi:AcrR family transcriptional regulator
MQARGQATFERILDATAVLLDQAGVEAITTNQIARAARVNVATLYQYFPNKQSVLLALYTRQYDTRIDLGERKIRGLGQAPDWRKALQSAVQAVAEAHASTPGAVALRQAMRSSPELLAHDQQMSARIAESLCDELVAAGLRGERAALIARCATETLEALLDLWTLDARGKDDRILAEAKAMLTAYLAPHLDRDGRANGRRVK